MQSHITSHMTLDKLNRRGGAVPAGRRTTVDADRQQQLRQALHATLPSTSTTSDVSQHLHDAMPKLLLRFGLSMLLFAGVAVAATLYFPRNAQPLVAQSDSAYRFMPAAKTAHASLHASTSSTGAPHVQVLAKYPHDANAFTQGLLVAKQGSDKFFIESTGLYGQSSLRKVAIETGTVLSQYDLPAELFGEGVTLTPSGELVMLTWKSRRGFVFAASEPSAATQAFTRVREFTYTTVTGEGWGIDTMADTNDGDPSNILVVSDGSATLQFWDATTMTEVRRVDVTFQGRAITQLNELEVANGYVYANIWYQRVVVKIEPQSGEIVAVFDCSALADAATTGDDSGAVLNGIAYDGDEDVFYVTGKLWRAVYKVRFVE